MASQQHRTDARGLVIPHGNWPLDRQAPAPLEAVRRFINTTNIESGADLLSSPSELRTWAASDGWPALGRVRRVDVDAAHRLRTLLRVCVESGVVPAELQSFAHRVPVVVSLDPVALRAAGSGATRLFSALIVGTFDAMANGTWPRLRACCNEHCRWVVYDWSKRGNARWCSDSACGGRARARDYRARNARTAPARAAR